MSTALASQIENRKDVTSQWARLFPVAFPVSENAANNWRDYMHMTEDGAYVYVQHVPNLAVRDAHMDEIAYRILSKMALWRKRGMEMESI